MNEASETERKQLLPERLAREQEALGMILNWISRSLAIGVIAVAAYVTYLNWT
jgi:hypothetical protein